MEHIGLEMNIWKEKRGFALVEVLVALVILSIALLALAGLMASTTRNNAAGGHLTEAATLAQDLLERLRLTPLNILTDNGMATGVPQTDYPPSPTASTFIYTRTWTCTQNIPASNNLHTITVTVSWVDQTAHSITMVSAVAL